MSEFPTISGLIRNEPNAVYHLNEALSFTKLKKFMRSPELLHSKDTLSSDALDIGSAVHERILEPERPACYALAPSTYNGSTKEGKEFKKKTEANGQILINKSNSEIVTGCVQALIHSPALSLFQQDYGEAELTWRVGGSFSAQCRTDWFCWNAPKGLEAFGITQGERYVADLKTTANLDDWFAESKWRNPLTSDLFYAGQEKFYGDIISNVLYRAGQSLPQHWLFVVVEKRAPHRVAVIRFA